MEKSGGQRMESFKRQVTPQPGLMRPLQVLVEVIQQFLVMILVVELRWHLTSVSAPSPTHRHRLQSTEHGEPAGADDPEGQSVF
jgi:hypothetical protein